MMRFLFLLLLASSAIAADVAQIWTGTWRPNITREDADHEYRYLGAANPFGTPWSTDQDIDLAAFRTRHGLVSAAHGAGPAALVSDRYEVALARATYQDPDRVPGSSQDVALYRGPLPEDLACLEISGSRPIVGEAVRWCGIDDHWRPEGGAVRVVALRPGLVLTETCDRIDQGDSGAPLVNALGEVVGMLIRRGRYQGRPAAVWVDGPTLRGFLGE